jgi:hypothetical protein
MRAVRIGNAQAFWGDRTDAAAEVLGREPNLDYLTFDYLAEVSMSILAQQREANPQAGFAQDFVDVVRTLVPYWSSGGRCRLITNAGGLNPRSCAEVCLQTIAEAGCRPLRIAIVTGDDVLQVIRDDCSSSEFCNLDTGAALGQVRDRLVSANAYLGAAPIVQGLAAGADIVITGRAADPSLTVAACMHHFGWTETDLDRLAGATVAGHLIECGTQVTGGISTDWLHIPNPAHIGFPIVEVFEDGSCIVTKPRGTGGRVTALNVKEQLLYEIGDPENYLSPDVTVSFLSLAVEELGSDRVRVCGATGKASPDMYKVSATYRDGFRSSGTLTIIGRNSQAKARRCGELVLARVRDAGHELRDCLIECLGSGDGAAGIVRPHSGDVNSFGETVLRVTVETDSREAAQYFSREMMTLITAGPQGTTGYAEGRPRVHPLYRYWPCLIARDQVFPQIELLEKGGRTIVPIELPNKLSQSVSPSITTKPQAAAPLGETEKNLPRFPHSRLYEIAVARSGDKGIHANVGIIARDAADWPFLQSWLTADRVAAFLSPLQIEYVERYELPNLCSLNFVLRGALRNTLRIDVQGKAIGQILLEMPLPE